MSFGLRAGEVVADTRPLTEAGLVFDGRIRTPWTNGAGGFRPPAPLTPGDSATVRE